MKIYPCIRCALQNESQGAHVTEIANQTGRFAVFRQQHWAQSEKEGHASLPRQTQAMTMSMRNFKDMCIYDITDGYRRSFLPAKVSENHVCF